MLIAAADYPFLEAVGTIAVFFLWVAWIWTVFSVLGDVFRRDDLGGGGKAAWVVFVILVPFLGVLVYLITQDDGMRERSVSRAQEQKAAMDAYVREAAGGSAAEIAKAKELLDAGAITQSEFDAIKTKALARA